MNTPAPESDPLDDPAAPPRSTRVIRRLPANLVNQIAAGEVIERPASVVKELVENAIDAGSKNIEIAITGGGVELIRIADDGCGMDAESMPLAVSSHATSKLPDEESLFHVRTLGFRGEALASIGSVSHMTIRSRTAGSDCGHELVVRGGVIEGPSPCGTAVGTVVEVKNLFFNTPVRHKFLKTANTERGHITEALTRLALANPHIRFSLSHNGRPTFDLAATTQWDRRIREFFGDEIGDNLIPISSRDDPIQIQGYVCDPSIHRGNNRMQYLFLNGRHIRDRSLGHAMGEAYRGLLMVGRFPVCFLQMRMSPDLVDVNVHPTKLEVRFTDGGRVYSRLLQTLRYEFLKTDMTHRVGIATDAATHSADSVGVGSDRPHAAGPSVPGSPLSTLSPGDASQRQEVIQWARTGVDPAAHQVRGMPPSNAGDGGPSPTGVMPSEVSPTGVMPTGVSPTGVSPTGGLPTGGLPGTVPGFRPFPGGSVLPPTSSAPTSSAPTSSAPAASSATGVQADAPEAVGPASIPADAPSVCYLGFQVHHRYLVTQDERGMVIIDQHALHERVLYERICARVLDEDSTLEAQRLLVPEPVSLTPAERTAALEVADLLRRIGLDIEDFGGDSIVIHSYPAMLPRTGPGEMLRTVLEALMGGGKKPDSKDLLNHLLSTIACKAAVKAGDPLSPEEITSLLEQKDLYRDTHHCPHGRPTALFFSRDELDRMFGRLGPRGTQAT